MHLVTNVDEFAGFAPSCKVESLMDSLEETNRKIAYYNKIKEDLVWRIVDATGIVEYHLGEDNKRVITNVAHEGQTTEKYGKYKAKFMTLAKWEVDTDKYNEIESLLRPKFNPITTVIKYNVSTKILKDIERYGTKDDLKAIEKFMVKSYYNPSITLSPNV